MHIDMVPNRGARPAYLLRESYREGTRVRKRTLANLSALSDEQIRAGGQAQDRLDGICIRHDALLDPTLGCSSRAITVAGYRRPQLTAYRG